MRKRQPIWKEEGFASYEEYEESQKLETYKEIEDKVKEDSFIKKIHKKVYKKKEAKPIKKTKKVKRSK